MHILKAVKTRDGVKTSDVFECPHFTVSERSEFFKIEFPLLDSEGVYRIREIKLPDDYDAIYHMSGFSGDTLDSWTWGGKDEAVRKVSHGK